MCIQNVVQLYICTHCMLCLHLDQLNTEKKTTSGLKFLCEILINPYTCVQKIYLTTLQECKLLSKGSSCKMCFDLLEYQLTLCSCAVVH